MPALASKHFMSLGCYALTGFPAFLTLSLLMKERPWLRAGWSVTSAAALLGLAYAFGAGGYVA